MAKRRKAMAERELDPLDRGCDDRNSRHDVERSEKLPYNRDRNVYRVDTGCQEIFLRAKRFIDNMPDSQNVSAAGPPLNVSFEGRPCFVLSWNHARIGCGNHFGIGVGDGEWAEAEEACSRAF